MDEEFKDLLGDLMIKEDILDRAWDKLIKQGFVKKEGTKYEWTYDGIVECKRFELIFMKMMEEISEDQRFKALLEEKIKVNKVR